MTLPGNQIDLDRASRPLRNAVDNWRKKRLFVGACYHYDEAKRTWFLELNGAVNHGCVSIPRIVVEVAEDGSSARIVVGGKWKATAKTARGVRSVLDRIEKGAIDVATTRKLVFDFFQGDEAKAAAWFSSPNPTLGGVIPNDLIALGRGQKLLEHVRALQAENTP